MWRPSLRGLTRRRSTVEHNPSIVFNHDGVRHRCDKSAEDVKILSTVFELKETSQPSASGTSPACVIDGVSGEKQHEFGLRDSRFSACVMAPNGQTCLTGDEKGTVVHWDLSSGTQKGYFRAHNQEVSRLAFSLSLDKIATASFDENTVRVWDIGSGTPKECGAFSNHGIRGIAISPHASTLYAACGDGIVHVWDVKSSKRAFMLKGHTEPVTGCARSRDGVIIVTCSKDRSVRLWDVRTLNSFHRKNLGVKANGCDITPDGYRVVACGENGKAEAFDTRDLQRTSRLVSSRWDLRNCAIYDEGRRAMVGSSVGEVMIYQIGWNEETLDNHSNDSGESPEPPIESLSEDGIRVADRARSRSKIEELYNLAIHSVPAYMATSSVVGHYEVLTPSALVNALVNEDGESNVSTLIDVFCAHTMFRTLLDFGHNFNNGELNGLARKNSFFYDNLYLPLSSVVESLQEKEMALRILDDAVAHGILNLRHRDTIVLGIHVMRETASRLRNLEDVLAEMYSVVTSRLSALESGLGRTVDALNELRKDRNREHRISRISAWVKLGLSLVPIVGPTAMSAAGVAGNVLLSFSPKDIVDMFTGVLGGIPDLSVGYMGTIRARDRKVDDDTIWCAESQRGAFAVQTEYAVRLVAVALSDEFLNKLAAVDRYKLVSVLTKHYRMSLDEMRREAHDAVFELKRRHVESIEPGASSDNGLLPLSYVVQRIANSPHKKKRSTDEVELNGERVTELTDELASNSSQIQANGATRDVNHGKGAALTGQETNGHLSQDSKAQHRAERMNTLRSLTVSETADLMSTYVCKTRGDEGDEMNKIIWQNVKQKGMSGRGLMSESITAELVARTVLYGSQKDPDNIDSDFTYLELLEYVRQLRKGEIDSPLRGN